MKRIMVLFLMAAATAFAGDHIPVYGPARAGVEDWDILQTTVLDFGVIVYDPSVPCELRVGDGITPGGIVVRQQGTVTNFAQVSTATTNLDMKHFHIRLGDWLAQGDPQQLAFSWRENEVWMRFLRDTQTAYYSYDFSVIYQENAVYGFTVPNVEGELPPVLEVSTNLIEGFEAASTNDYGVARRDVGHVRLVYTNNPPLEAIFFRMFNPNQLTEGIYAFKPFHATEGLVIPEGRGITMGTNTWFELPDLSGIAANAAAIAAQAEAIAANAGNIATNNGNIAANAAAIAINAGNIFSNTAALTTLTNALGHRVSEFEEIDLGIVPTMSTNAADNVWVVPTNIPTRCLNINIDATGFTSTNYPFKITIPGDWAPSKPLCIRFICNRAHSNSRLNYIMGSANRSGNYNHSTAQRIGEAFWVPQCGAWRWHWSPMQAGMSFYSANGNAYNGATAALASTIEEWVEWRSQQAW